MCMRSQVTTKGASSLRARRKLVGPRHVETRLAVSLSKVKGHMGSRMGVSCIQRRVHRRDDPWPMSSYCGFVVTPVLEVKVGVTRVILREGSEGAG